MAILTNKNNHPTAIYNAVKNDPYTKGKSDYSVTELIKPARIVALEKLHDHEIVEDVEDRIWSLLGQAVHTILERAGEKEASEITELRFFGKFLDKIVGGQIDHLHMESGVLSDYKVSTKYKFMDDSDTADWEAQLNMQAEILRQNGFRPLKLQIVGIIRDFSTREAKWNPDLPQTPIKTIDIPFWDSEKTIKYIEWRIKEHEMAKKELPMCNPGDRWHKPETWAVIEKGKKKATRVFLLEEAAIDFSSSLKGSRIDHRKSEDKRCETYCRVSKWCLQYQNSLQNKEK